MYIPYFQAKHMWVWVKAERIQKQNRKPSDSMYSVYSNLFMFWMWNPKSHDFDPTPILICPKSPHKTSSGFAVPRFPRTYVYSFHTQDQTTNFTPCLQTQPTFHQPSPNQLPSPSHPLRCSGQRSRPYARLQRDQPALQALCIGRLEPHQAHLGFLLAERLR